MNNLSSLSSWKLRHIHKEQFPRVTVEVFNGALLHEAVIAEFARFCSTSCEAFFHGGVHGVGTFQGQGIQSGKCVFRVGNRFCGKSSKLVCGHDHQKDVVTPHHAFRGFIRKLWVIRKTQCAIKVH